MKRLFTVLCISLSLFSYSMTRDEFTEETRNQMGRFGLFTCIGRYLPKKEYEKDQLPTYYGEDIHEMIRKGMQSYGLFGGRYDIVQNEDTLAIIYNPYDAVYEYIVGLSYKKVKNLKLDMTYNPLVACMHAYDSKEYKDFIKSMDIYIDYSILEKLKKRNAE